ncbi:MAG: hypothetical protein ACJAXJ_003374 [Colwellia sp.]|jgi:hypothetical protein
MKIKELAQAAYDSQLEKMQEQWNLPIDRQLHGEVTTTEYDDTQRSRLTMRHIRQLRKMKDIERVEQKAHAELIAVMYSYVEPKPKPPETAAGE